MFDFKRRVGNSFLEGFKGLIGGVLDEAGLDDLMVLGQGGGGVYDVGLVVRLLRVFVCEKELGLVRLKKVGRLIDAYMVELSPDPGLKVPKLLDVVEGLPDDARDCFDGVYNAIDIYLQTHPSLSIEEKSRLCKCLNYEKLSLECFRNVANNPRIPPKIAMEALTFRQSTIPPISSPQIPSSWEAQSGKKVEAGRPVVEKEEIRANLERMHFRVSELERYACR